MNCGPDRMRILNKNKEETKNHLAKFSDFQSYRLLPDHNKASFIHYLLVFHHIQTSGSLFWAWKDQFQSFPVRDKSEVFPTFWVFPNHEWGGNLD